MRSICSLIPSRSGVLLAMLAAMIVCFTPAQATAAEGDKVYVVLAVKFKPGKAPEALAIVRGHVFPGDRTIGRNPIPFDFMTGEWDHVVYFPFDPAKGDTVPGWDVWMKALAAQEGGMDKALQLFDRFWSLAQDSRTEMATLPAAWAR